jgi:hypothetical protein
LGLSFVSFFGFIFMESSPKRAFIKTMGQQFSSRNTEIRSWFNALVGVDEKEFAALRQEDFFFFFFLLKMKSVPSENERSVRFFRLDEKGNTRLMRGGGGKPHNLDVNCGRFELFAIDELAKSVDASAAVSKGRGSLTFITRKDADVGSLQAVDVAHLQAEVFCFVVCSFFLLPACFSKSENVGAMFQVASNMNGVEGISQETSVEVNFLNFLFLWNFNLMSGTDVCFGLYFRQNSRSCGFDQLWWCCSCARICCFHRWKNLQKTNKNTTD